MLGFWDSEKVRRILNKIFLLVITAMIGHFDVFRILIDGSSSCDMMYSKVCEKMSWDKEKLWPYEGFDLQAFNGRITHPLGYTKLMIIVWRYVIVVDSLFPVVPWRRKNIYKCILDRPFTISLDAVAPSVQLKLKFHKIHYEPITVNIDLYRTNRIYKALQQDQKFGGFKAMEINVTSLIIQYINIIPPTGKAGYLGQKSKKGCSKQTKGDRSSPGDDKRWQAHLVILIVLYKTTLLHCIVLCNFYWKSKNVMLKYIFSLWLWNVTTSLRYDRGNQCPATKTWGYCHYIAGAWQK